MDLWYSEKHAEGVKFSIQVNAELYSEQSNYQHIAVFSSLAFGKILTLDGVLMLTEREEFIYHEMITHPAFAVNPDIKKVLVIGAGDGGVARELCKYKQIESIDIVEIDKRVVEICREYIPSCGKGFDDSRINLIFADGLQFVRRTNEKYDLIIVDSTDPTGPGEVLFTKEFYGNCHKALAEKGIMINQHESPFYKNDAAAARAARKRISQAFSVSAVYQAHIPTYPSGHWLFGFASKNGISPECFDEKKWQSLGISCRYYNTRLHRGAFLLPTYVEEMFDET